MAEWKTFTSKGAAHAFEPNAEKPLCGRKPNKRQPFLPMGVVTLRKRCKGCNRIHKRQTGAEWSKFDEVPPVEVTLE